MHAFHFAIVAAIVFALADRSWAAVDKAPEKETGLKVGAKAPAFTLRDQRGNDRTLDDFLKKGNVALVFYRSAGW